MDLLELDEGYEEINKWQQKSGIPIVEPMNCKNCNHEIKEFEGQYYHVIQIDEISVGLNKFCTYKVPSKEARKIFSPYSKQLVRDVRKKYGKNYYPSLDFFEINCLCEDPSPMNEVKQ